MPLPLRKRVVHFYEIHLQANTRSAVTRPSTASLPDLLACFQRLAGPRSLPFSVGSSSKVRTNLVAWRYDVAGDHYELLLNRADVAVSDVALRDFQTSGLRTAGKTRVEGIEVSAHVIVRPNANRQTALVLLTMGAGIGPGNLERLFRSLAKAAGRLSANRHLYSFDDPSGAVNGGGQRLQYKVHYGFAVYGHQGQNLQNALHHGQFESMELIAHERAQFDSGGTFHTEKRTLKLEASVPRTVTAASVFNAVRNYFGQANAEQFDQLRVQYKTPAGKSTSAMLDIANLDAAFTLKEHIQLDTDVQEQQNALNEPILRLMRPLLALVPR